MRVKLKRNILGLEAGTVYRAKAIKDGVKVFLPWSLRVGVFANWDDIEVVK